LLALALTSSLLLAPFARSARAEEPAPQTAPETAPMHEPVRLREKSSTAPLLVIAAGGAGLLTGAVLGFFAVNKRDDALKSSVNEDAATREEDAKSLATTANIAFGAGAAVAVGGLVWLLINKSGVPESSVPDLGLAISPGAVVLTGAF
jgi:hypothetical protein